MKGMASLKTLSGLKSSQLKHTAFLIGLPTTGTKAELEGFIRHHTLERPTLRKLPRIVSVDMGIKNLGICVLEAPQLFDAGNSTGLRGGDAHVQSPLKVLAWKKVDVSSLLAPQDKTPAGAAATSDDAVPAKSGRQRRATVQPTVPATVFSPSSLSGAALSITKDIVSTYGPTHILIERQRFRSGGAAAVQEWTLRVNMLESMIWACLATMRDEYDPTRDGEKLQLFPHMHEISPARVARFWCSGPPSVGLSVQDDLFDHDWKAEDVSSVTALRKTNKIEKKEKIAVVRSWLSQNGKPAPNEPYMALEFADDAGVVANAFLSDIKKGKKQDGNEIGKLDDLADCLLQGVAWVRWEENRRKIKSMLNAFKT